LLPFSGVDGLCYDFVVCFEIGGETGDELESAELPQITGGNEFAVGDVGDVGGFFSGTLVL